MSLVTRFKGDIKQGKTLSAVYFTMKLAHWLGLGADHIFTNLRNCYDHQKRCGRCHGRGTIEGAICASCNGSGENPNHGVRWATTVDIDDVIVDLSGEDIDEQVIKNGVLLWDEAQGLLNTNATRGTSGPLINSILTECGKRGLPLVYTTHLDMMVNPTARGLTMIDILCIRKREFQGTVLWNVSDQRKLRLAIAQGMLPPMPDYMVLKQVHKLYRYYETNEAASPFALATSSASTKSLDKFSRRIATKAAERGIVIPGLEPETPKRSNARSRIDDALDAIADDREERRNIPSTGRDIGGGVSRPKR